MKKNLFHATGLSILALIGGAILMIALIVIVSSLQSYTQKPEDLLPADATIAVFVNPTEDSLRSYDLWLPILTHLPVLSNKSAVALLALPQGGQGIVVFARRSATQAEAPATAAGENIRTMGSFSVLASSPDVWPLIDASSMRLAQFKPFRTLSRNKGPTLSWNYLRASVLPLSGSLTDTLLSSLFFGKAACLAVTPHNEQGRTVVEIENETSFWDTASAAPLPPVPSNPVFSISLPGAENLLKEILENLPRDRRFTLESTLLTRMTDTFGNEASMEFDLLPLLKDSIAFSLTEHAEKKPSFLLSGTADEATLSPLLTRLHDSVHAGLPSARVVTRILDKGRYVFRNLRSDTSGTEEKKEKKGEWQLHSTIHAVDGKGLFSAVNGKSYLLSNDAELIAEVTGGSGSLLSSPEAALARGSLDLSFLTSSGLSATSSLLTFPSPLFPEKAKTLRWLLSRRNTVTTLTFIPE
ncbi:MAG: hypothetical protein PHE68_02415 [Candidatus Peribacteraceae bacterium]|nr:hypothetical protein [Candidatus Peribacteraceae bacterium]MDD5074290.1 hypothetical protein [Candidatus Peribacteraceae bacterium]